MCVQYIGGCSVHRGGGGGVFSISGDTMSTSGDIMMHVGDTMSTSGDIMMHVGELVDESLSISVPFKFPDVLNMPLCTHGIPPMY